MKDRLLKFRRRLVLARILIRQGKGQFSGGGGYSCWAWRAEVLPAYFLVHRPVFIAVKIPVIRSGIVHLVVHGNDKQDTVCREV